MSKDAWKVLFYLVVAFGIWLLGFYLGRKTIKIPQPGVEIVYDTLPPIHDSIPYPKPVTVLRPIDTANIIKQCVKDGIYQELFPEKIITQIVEVTKDDTTAIIKDWATKRYYSEKVFDIDTVGKMTVDAEVQYNRLKMVGYDYRPVQKTVTETRYVVKAFRPFIGVGGAVNPWDEKKDPQGAVSAGFFIKEKVGFEVDYQHSFKSKNDYVGGKILFSF
jgi:hypothetical protein